MMTIRQPIKHHVEPGCFTIMGCPIETFVSVLLPCASNNYRHHVKCVVRCPECDGLGFVDEAESCFRCEGEASWEMGDYAVLYAQYDRELIAEVVKEYPRIDALANTIDWLRALYDEVSAHADKEQVEGDIHFFRDELEHLRGGLISEAAQ